MQNGRRDPARIFKTLQNVAREAMQTAREYERSLGMAMEGRYEIQPGEELDEEGLLGFLDLTLAETTHRRVVVTVLTFDADRRTDPEPTRGREEASNGQQTQVRQFQR